MRTLPVVGRVIAVTFLGFAAGGFAAAAASRNVARPAPAFTLPIQRLVRGPAASGKIQHVVIIFQENRSFDNLFQGYPGADTRPYGYDSNGNKITLSPVDLQTWWDIDHSSGAFFAACNGRGKIPGTKCRMNGFNNEYVSCGGSCPSNPQYAYVPQTETVPYFTMAGQYVLADRMFASNFDASSFISHQYIIAGQAASAVNYPNGAWGCEGGSSDVVYTVTVQPPRQYGNPIQACFNDTTLGQEADNAGVSWRFYAAQVSDIGTIWSAYQANQYVYYGPDWSSDVITPNTQFFNDVQNGYLANITWITPTCGNSDHAGCDTRMGPAWVTSLVNAIGESQFWSTTAIFVMWDEYGGWYDHVPPAYVDYDGLGMRVPLLIISPYAKKGHVSHVHYEHGSILRFTEDQFGLPRMTASDTRANSPEQDAFNFNRPPRRFVRIPSNFDKRYFMSQPPDRRIPDRE